MSDLFYNDPTREAAEYTHNPELSKPEISNVNAGQPVNSVSQNTSIYSSVPANYGMTVPSQTYPNGPVNDKKKKPKKAKKGSFGRTAAKTVAVAAIFGIVAGGAFQGVNYGVDKLRGNTSESTSASAEEDDLDNTVLAVRPQQVVQPATGSVSTLSYDVADVVATAQPSIVSITTTVTQTYQYFFQSFEQDSTGAGSGIIIGQNDKTLYIATNYHVVEGANEIKVGFNDGEIVTATVKGYDEDADIAVVAVNEADMKSSTLDAISVASVGDSDKLRVGEPSIAIGNALGYGQSVTVGYISALNRSIANADGTFIQTDAAINPGNSGGALIDSQGQVIGINSVKYVDSTVEGMGFSIPINDAMVIINDIIKGTQIGNVYLGISGADISREYSQIYGFPMGVYVKEIQEASPAFKGQLHTGDIIVEFDGQEVYTMEDLQKLLKKHKEGDKVTLGIYRADMMGDYDQTTVDVTLEAGQ